MKTKKITKGNKTYELSKLLGEGSFAKVYYSHPYAIKQISLNVQQYLKQALENEIKILQSFKHPNIVLLHDVIKEGSHVYLVMEYCQQDLSKYMKRNNFDEIKAIEIFKQILSGFRQLVKNGIIHRDLKPANILVNSKEEFKLADFGFAKFVDQFGTNMLQTCVGTPLYMAPQILKRQKYNTRCDIWSIGFIFYEMITKKLPWNGYSQNNLLQNITKKPLTFPSGVSEWSKNILKRMLVVNENDRICWEQLFQYVFRTQSPTRRKNISLAKGRNNRSDSQDSFKIVTEKCIQQRDRMMSGSIKKNTSAKSEKQMPAPPNIPKPNNVQLVQPKQIMYCPEAHIKQMFFIELCDHFQQDKAQQLAFMKNIRICNQDQPKVKEVLQLFVEDARKYLEKNMTF